mgnify:CR=1 FL=1
MRGIGSRTTAAAVALALVGAGLAACIAPADGALFNRERVREGAVEEDPPSPHGPPGGRWDLPASSTVPEDAPAAPAPGAPAPKCSPEEPVPPPEFFLDDGLNAGTGLPCNEACHDGRRGTGLDAHRTFTFAGTLYDAPRNGKKLQGATIKLTDAKGKVVTMVSEQSGSFWTEAQLAAPVTVTVSLCPDTKTMTHKLGATASCNSSGCHGTRDNRVYLDVRATKTPPVIF